MRKSEWVVYAKPSFAGPEAVLAHLSRYTHRVAIALDDNGVSFRGKDYRAIGRERQKIMTLAPDEFIRRFLIHILPRGFRRIRHDGLFGNGNRARPTDAPNLAAVSAPEASPTPAARARGHLPRRQAQTNLVQSVRIAADCGPWRRKLKPEFYGDTSSTSALECAPGAQRAGAARQAAPRGPRGS